MTKNGSDAQQADAVAEFAANAEIQDDQFLRETAASMGGRRVFRRKVLPTTYPHDPGGSRTHDLRIKSPLLYQLSYRVGHTIQS